MKNFLESKIPSNLFIEGSIFKGRYTRFTPYDVKQLINKFKQQYPRDWSIARDKDDYLYAWLKGSKEVIFKYDIEDMILYIDQNPYRIIRGQEDFQE